MNELPSSTQELPWLPCFGCLPNGSASVETSGSNRHWSSSNC